VNRMRMEFIHVQGKREFADVKDCACHLTTHLLLYEMTRLQFDPAWLQEGLAYWVTDRLLQTAATRCVRVETAVDGGREPVDVLDWKRAVKEDAAAEKAPPLRELLFSAMTNMTPAKVLKSWGFVDFLLREHREAFVAFAAGLKANQPQDAALTK